MTPRCVFSLVALAGKVRDVGLRSARQKSSLSFLRILYPPCSEDKLIMFENAKA